MLITLMGKNLALYSKKAMPHEKTMTPSKGHERETPVSLSFRCPYQANVMNTLLSMSKIMV